MSKSPIRVVSFDCAGTLVRVNWQPGRFAVECAAKCGLSLEAGHAEAVYMNLLQSRWRDYQDLHRTRDETVLDGFWKSITEDWLASLGAGPKWAQPIFDQALRDLYQPGTAVFQLYDDVLPALEKLEAKGLRLAVLSNWDYSLHRVLRLLEIRPYFEVVAASLEEGPEKPDPALFEIVLERLGVHPQEVLHVGDDPIDDMQGAQRSGLRATLIDRAGQDVLPIRIADLRRIDEVVDWTG